jgi:hypothetical protein
MERAQLVLPWAEREWIDVPRTCRILGCSWTTIVRLVEAGSIDLLDFRRRGWKKIRYASVVTYCDRLREQFAIADRRPPLSSPILRHRDEDLLPFPLRDTIGVADVREALNLGYQTRVLQFIEEGAFEAYQLIPGSPWRVSLSSFQRWLDDRHAAAVRASGENSPRQAGVTAEA